MNNTENKKQHFSKNTNSEYIEVIMQMIDKKNSDAEESIQQLALSFGQSLEKKGFSNADMVTAATIIIDQAIKFSSKKKEEEPTKLNHKLHMIK